MKNIVLWCAVFLVASAAFADGDRILLPLVTEDLQGAYGSLWHVNVTLRNDSDVAMHVQQVPCMIPCAYQWEIPAHSTFVPPLLRSNAGQVPGTILTIAEDDAQMWVSSRAQDLSREAETWGTEIRAVRASEFFTGAATLLDIPTDPRFRSTLRIYDTDGNAGRRIRIQILPLNEDTILVDTVGTFVKDDRNDEPPRAYIPGYIQIGDLVAAFPQLIGTDRLRIRLTPLTVDHFWAFASVTNNETQHFTTVSPQ